MRRILWLDITRREREAPTNDLLVQLLNEVIELRREIYEMQQQIQDALNELKTEVSSVRDTEQAAVTLIQGLQTQLANALSSSSDPTEVVAAVQAVHDQLTQDAAPLAAAVTANTQPAPTPAPTPGAGDATDPTA